MTNTKPLRMTLAFDADVLDFARKAALKQSKPGKIKATSEVLRDLLREGMTARQTKPAKESQ